MSKQKIFGRSRPSIAYELKYRREIQSLIEEMKEDIISELLKQKNKIASDSRLGFWYEILKAMREKWYGRFRVRGRELSRWLSDKTRKRSKAQIMRKMKELGMTLEPHYTKHDKTLIKAITEKNAQEIESIPQVFLKTIQTAVAGAFEAGYDSEQLTDVIERVAGTSRNRAALLARDQMNKATQDFSRMEAQAVGATKGRWIHVPGKYSSRISHEKMNGKVFDLNTGMYDSFVHKYVKPGELIYCNCQCEYLIPGFEI